MPRESDRCIDKHIVAADRLESIDLVLVEPVLGQYLPLPGGCGSEPDALKEDGETICGAVPIQTNHRRLWVHKLLQCRFSYAGL